MCIEKSNCGFSHWYAWGSSCGWHYTMMIFGQIWTEYWWRITRKYQYRPMRGYNYDNYTKKCAPQQTRVQMVDLSASKTEWLTNVKWLWTWPLRKKNWPFQSGVNIFFICKMFRRSSTRCVTSQLMYNHKKSKIIKYKPPGLPEFLYHHQISRTILHFIANGTQWITDIFDNPTVTYYELQLSV